MSHTPLDDRLHAHSVGDKISATMMRTWLVAFCFSSVALASPPSYSRDVRPILQRQCQGCHQPNQRSGGLDLTTFEGFAKGGNRGPAEGLILKYVKGESQPRMPLGGQPLTAEEIGFIAGWIAAGAKDDTPPDAKDSISAATPPIYYQPPVISALAFSPDGKTLAVSGYREILLHSADGDGVLKRLVGLSERLNSITFSKDGTSLIAAGGTPARFGEVQVWNLSEAKLKRSITTTTDTLFGLSLSPDGKEMAVGAADNSVRLIETASGKELQKIGNHENWVLGTVFGIDGKRVVSIGRDRAAKLSDAASGAFLENVNLLRGELAAIARNPNKDVVVIGGEDRIPYIYMMDRPKVMKTADDSTLVRKLPRQNGAISALVWSPDGAKIGVGGMGTEVNIYNPDSGELVASCKSTPGIYALAFTPDSARLAIGGFDGHVRICDAATGSLIKDFIPVPLTHAAGAATGSLLP
jgi:WD40 repeat protein